MASEGPNSPGTLANVVTAGWVWINPGNAATSNNSYALVLGSSGPQDSDQLQATNFGFSIPAGATINGVVVEIERNTNANSGNTVRDLTVRLVKGGTVTGDNKADTGTNWPGSDTIKSYGGASDLWGATLTASDVNASNFGVVLAVRQNIVAPKAFSTAFVDHIRITVHYTEGGGGGGEVRRVRRLASQGVG